MQASTERQKPNRQQREKHLNSFFNTQTVKNLVQMPSYIKPSLDYQKQATLKRMN